MELKIESESPEKVIWSLSWKLDSETITQKYELTAAGLRIHCVRTDPAAKPLPLVFEIPVLHFNGKEYARWTVRGRIAEGRLNDGRVRFSASAELKSDDTAVFSNRSGIYHRITASAPEGVLDLFFEAD